MLFGSLSGIQVSCISQDDKNLLNVLQPLVGWESIRIYASKDASTRAENWVGSGQKSPIYPKLLFKKKWSICTLFLSNWVGFRFIRIWFGSGGFYQYWAYIGPICFINVFIWNIIFLENGLLSRLLDIHF